MHKEEIANNIDFMLESIELIEARLLKIELPEEFVKSSDGMTILDAISMRLQVIGETVRKIQKAEPTFLENYLEIEWDKIARFRDFVSHHYNQIDHEIIFDICKAHIPKLKVILQKIRSEYLTPDTE